MTRIKISGAILCLLLIMSVITGIWSNKRCERLISLTDKTISLYSEGRKDEAAQSSRELESEWESFRVPASLLIYTNKLTEIDRICSRISYYAENDGVEMMSSLMELRHMLDLLKSGESPSFTTVL